MANKSLGVVAAIGLAGLVMAGCSSEPSGSGTITKEPIVASQAMKVANLSVKGMT